MSLHVSAGRGDNDTLRKLLQEVIDSSPADELRMTPLHYAAVRGHTATVILLLEHHASIDARDIFGCTPVFYAAKMRRYDTLQTLLDYGADVEIRNKDKVLPYTIGDTIVRRLILLYVVKLYKIGLVSFRAAKFRK